MRRQAVESNSLIRGLLADYAGLLNPGSSPLPDLFVQGESGLYVVCEAVLIREDDAERGSIFNGLAGPLGLMRLFVSQSLRAPFGGRRWV